MMGRFENDPFDRSGLPRGEAPRVLPLRPQEGEGAPGPGEDGTKKVKPYIDKTYYSLNIALFLSNKRLPEGFVDFDIF